jgi:hypothetical protein
MSVRLTLLSHAFPRRLKLWMLDALARVTAEGFATRMPDLSGRDLDVRLAAYAAFTAQEAGLLVAGGDTAAITAAKERLRRGALGLGARVRRGLGLRQAAETLAAWRLLYRQIGIDVTGSPGGEVTVTRCFFADYYPESVCEVIAALDDGLAAGLFGGARLEFSERLTGGGPCCRAVLRLGEKQG